MYVPNPIEKILLKLQDKGYTAYIVGGSVRDSILGRVPLDYDIATSATPQEVLLTFEKTIPTGMKHGTVTVVQDDFACEVTTYRVEKKYIDYRRPENIQFAQTIEEDLTRRDFTINAIAYNGNSYVDPLAGIDDLKNKVIKAVGNPDQRFQEDALRMLRAVRFAVQLGFQIEPATYNAVQKNSKLIQHISYERIRDELCKILLSDQPSLGIRLLHDLELLQWFLPELEECVDFEQRNPHHDKDVFEHILAVLDHTPKELITRLAALFHDIGKPPAFTIDGNGVGHFYEHENIGANLTKTIMKRLKFDLRMIERVSILVKEHMCRYDQVKTKTVKRLINRVRQENLPYFFDLQIADLQGHGKNVNIDSILDVKKEAERILSEQEPLSIKDLALKGSDLLQLGFSPNKELGLILDDLLQIVIEDPNLNKKEKLLELVNQKYNKR